MIHGLSANGCPRVGGCVWLQVTGFDSGSASTCSPGCGSCKSTTKTRRGRTSLADTLSLQPPALVINSAGLSRTFFLNKEGGYEMAEFDGDHVGLGVVHGAGQCHLFR